MMLLGNYKTAIVQYEKSIAINPNVAAVHNNLGISLLEWDRMEEAETHYVYVPGQPPQKKTVKIGLVSGDKTEIVEH